MVTLYTSRKWTPTLEISMNIDKYKSNHICGGKTDGKTRTEVHLGNIYKFVQYNVVTYGVTERWTLMTQVVIDTF